MRLDEIQSVTSLEWFKRRVRDRYGEMVDFVPEDEAIYAVDPADDAVVYGIFRKDLQQGEIYDEPLAPGGEIGQR